MRPPWVCPRPSFMAMRRARPLAQTPAPNFDALVDWANDCGGYATLEPRRGRPRPEWMLTVYVNGGEFAGSIAGSDIEVCASVLCGKLGVAMSGTRGTSRKETRFGRFSQWLVSWIEPKPKRVVIVNNFATCPGDPHKWARQVAHEMRASEGFDDVEETQ